MKKIPQEIQEVILQGHSLTIEEVIAVARWGAKVFCSEDARKKVLHCRTLIDVLVNQDIVAYGINTGFGALRDCIIPKEKIKQLQKNLIRSHACGVGKPLSQEIIRACILLRANTLLKGNSGVRMEIIDALVQMLNLGICPFVPCKGSVGASGDLSPLSHIALVVIGDPQGLFSLWNKKRDFQQEEKYFCSTPEELQKWGYSAIELSYKEGLALNNGTQVMSAIACLTLYDSFVLLHSSEMATALSMEAAQGVATSLDERIHNARPLAYQPEVARRLRAYLHGSTLLSSPLNAGILYSIQEKLSNLGLQNLWNTISLCLEEYRKNLAEAKPWEISHNQKALQEAKKTRDSIVRSIESAITSQAYSIEICLELRQLLESLKKSVPALCPTQDDYSFRCASQVLACAWRAWEHAREVVSQEINSATDNPLIFPPEMPKHEIDAYESWLKNNPELCAQSVVSGGNFHGEPVGMVMDYLAIALCEIASISERRIAHLVDPKHSNGLPAFLAKDAGLNSGFMIPQYTAASLVSENKVLSHPATVDSIPTSGNTEDHVSMATIAARKCKDILENSTFVVAIEFMVCHQALFFRLLEPGNLAQRFQKMLSEYTIESPVLNLKGIPFFQSDGVWYPIIQEFFKAIQEEKFLALAETQSSW